MRLRFDRAERDALHRRARRLRALRALDARAEAGLRCVSVIVTVTLAFCVSAILAAILSFLAMGSVIYLYLVLGRAVWVCSRTSVAKEGGGEVCEEIPRTACELCMCSPCLGITWTAATTGSVRGGGHSEVLEIASNDGSDAVDDWSLLDDDTISLMDRVWESGRKMSAHAPSPLVSAAKDFTPSTRPWMALIFRPLSQTRSIKEIVSSSSSDQSSTASDPSLEAISSTSLCPPPRTEPVVAAVQVIPRHGEHIHNSQAVRGISSHTSPPPSFATDVLEHTQTARPRTRYK
jgi:hypothetical protein